LAPRKEELPGDVRALLREAARRIEEFRSDGRVPGFVPCDFARAYRTLLALAEGSLAPGNLFCEWGSGFGVVTCLAALLDLDAWGIEIESELVDAARQLASDFDLPATFHHGSFLPNGTDLFRTGEQFAWLSTEEGLPDAELGPEDFDVIFAYPWPDEERLVCELFERHARRGALLLTYHGTEEIRVRRKVGSGR
jgi:hypothetical protein